MEKPYNKPMDVDPHARNDATPSHQWNSPFGMEAPHGRLPDNMGVEQQGFNISVLSPRNVLASIRAQFPFLPIIPFPSEVKTLFLPVAGTAADLYFPDGAAVAMFRGNQNYLMSLHGNAQVPTAALTGQGEFDTAASKSFFAPEGVPFFIHGVKSASFVSDMANTYVTAIFWPIGLINGG